MRHLGDEIIQEGFDSNNLKYRDSCRGIFFNEKKELLLIYSSYYNDVSFPGGGVDPGETLEQALFRECLEESGVIIDTYEECFKITEKRKSGISREECNVFTSHYFMCTYKKIVEASLLDYEIELGYQTVWMNIDDAIELNKKAYAKLLKSNKYIGVMIRELRVLEELKNKL